MNRLVELGRLLDAYGKLLTARQRELLRQYAFEDCSLSEIAEREGVSRQAVRDAIARTEQQLRAFEDSLGLVQRHDAMRLALRELTAAATFAHLSEAERTELTARIAAVAACWEDEDGV